MRSDFRDLEIWQKGQQIRKIISELVKVLPMEEKYRLGDQMIRASRSITANIAEGYGRFHYQETVQFCRQARGSAYELFDHMTVAYDCNYIDVDKFNDLELKIKDFIKQLNGYIKYLKDKKISSCISKKILST